MAIEYIDHHLLAKIAGCADKIEDDPQLVKIRYAVREEIEKLGSPKKEIITGYFFENNTLDDIAGRMGVPFHLVQKELHAAITSLRHSLKQSVAERWPNSCDDIPACGICLNPQISLIERILTERSPNESWRITNDKIYNKTKQRFNPPSILINHLKYHMKG